MHNPCTFDRAAFLATVLAKMRGPVMREASLHAMHRHVWMQFARNIHYRHPDLPSARMLQRRRRRCLRPCMRLPSSGAAQHPPSRRLFRFSPHGPACQWRKRAIPDGAVLSLLPSFLQPRWGVLAKAREKNASFPFLPPPLFLSPSWRCRWRPPPLVK